MHTTLIRAAVTTALICTLPIATPAPAQLSAQDDVNSAQIHTRCARIRDRLRLGL
ncbi:hypothetical protein [Paraburkholderia sp. JPY419]|uniref:hypothetical protein n=1 Tax=Paraburkholderia sp. JPY419 TaxID=667660 RepID=UPI003D195AFF